MVDVRRAHAVLARARRGRRAGRRRRPGERDRLVAARGFRPRWGSTPSGTAASPTAIPEGRPRGAAAAGHARRPGARRGTSSRLDAPATASSARQLVAADLREPLHRHEATLVDGRAPVRPDEVLISPSLAERICRRGIGLAESTPPHGPPLTVVGIARRPFCLSCEQVVALPGSAPAEAARPSRGSTAGAYLVDLPPGATADALWPELAARASRSRRATPTAPRALRAARAAPGRRDRRSARHRAGHADRRPRPARGRAARRHRVRRRRAPPDARARPRRRERRQRPARPPDRARPGPRARRARRGARRRRRRRWSRRRRGRCGSTSTDGRIIGWNSGPGDRRRGADRPALGARRRGHPGGRRRADAAGRRARRALPDEPLARAGAACCSAAGCWPAGVVCGLAGDRLLADDFAAYTRELARLQGDRQST